MKSILLFLVFILTNFSLLSQRGYYVIGNVKYAGVEIEETSGMSQYHQCTIVSGEERTTYLPSEIKEYSVDGKSVFVSKEIEIRGQYRPIFLRRLVHGDLSIYSTRVDYHDVFFIETDSSGLVKLSYVVNGESFTDLLEIYAGDCPYADIDRVEYSRHSLVRYAKDYNVCEPEGRKFSYGLSAGINTSNVHITSSNTFILGREMLFDGRSLAFGTFAQFNVAGDFLSVVASLDIGNFTGRYYKTVDDLSYHMEMKSRSFYIPLETRYKISKGSVQFYVGAGPSFQFQKKLEDVLQVYNDVEDELVKIYHPDYRAGVLYGFTGTIGFEIEVAPGYSVFTGLRYNLGTGNEDDIFRNVISTTGIQAGFHFK